MVTTASMPSIRVELRSVRRFNRREKEERKRMKPRGDQNRAGEALWRNEWVVEKRSIQVKGTID